MEAYRVRKNFQWDGWIYAPRPESGECKCDCGEENRCTGMVATGCVCSGCRCDCAIKTHLYGGDVWFVDENNPRKEMMLAHRFATYDSSLPPTDSMLEQDEYKRLLTMPPTIDGRRKRVVAAN